LIRNLAGRLDQQWLGMKAKVVVARKIAVILHCIWVMVIALSGDRPRRPTSTGKFLALACWAGDVPAGTAGPTSS
jgi:hypothetical protein